MVNSIQKGRSGVRKRRKALPKEMLLPLGPNLVRRLSLSAHLTLAACSCGHGRRALLYRLARITYLSYFLWEAGFGGGEYGMYCNAERVLDDLSREWEDEMLEYADHGKLKALEPILSIYDDQIYCVPRHILVDCEERLDQLIRFELLEHRVDAVDPKQPQDVV